MEQTKRCPYCGEEILTVAKKCKHCGEWMKPKETPKAKKPCPICGEMVDEDLDTCPCCHEPTHFGVIDVPDPVVSVSQKTESLSSNTPSANTYFTTKALHYILKIVPYILLGALLAFAKFGIKQCSKQRDRKDSFGNISILGDSFKKDRDAAFSLLTKAPWHGKNSITNTSIEEGVSIKTTITIDSKKIYSDSIYTEAGTMAIVITGSQSELEWSVEGKIRFHEKGNVSLYSKDDMYEKSTEISCNIIGAEVLYNNTDADNEDIAMNMRLQLNEMIKEMKNDEESSHYRITSLSDEKLVLDLMDNEKLFKTTGYTLIYNR